MRIEAFTKPKKERKFQKEGRIVDDSALVRISSDASIKKAARRRREEDKQRKKQRSKCR